MAINHDDITLAFKKLHAAEKMLRSLDDFAVTLLGKTAEALDLIEQSRGLMLGVLTIDNAELGTVKEKEESNG